MPTFRARFIQFAQQQATNRVFWLIVTALISALIGFIERQFNGNDIHSLAGQYVDTGINPMVIIRDWAPERCNAKKCAEFRVCQPHAKHQEAPLSTWLVHFADGRWKNGPTGLGRCRRSTGYPIVCIQPASPADQSLNLLLRQKRPVPFFDAFYQD